MLRDLLCKFNITRVMIICMFNKLRYLICSLPGIPESCIRRVNGHLFEYLFQQTGFVAKGLSAFKVTVCGKNSDTFCILHSDKNEMRQLLNQNGFPKYNHMLLLIAEQYRRYQKYRKCMEKLRFSKN